MIHKISYYKIRVSTGGVETRWLGWQFLNGNRSSKSDMQLDIKSVIKSDIKNWTSHLISRKLNINTLQHAATCCNTLQHAAAPAHIALHLLCCASSYTTSSLQIVAMSASGEKKYHVLFKKIKKRTASDSEWRAADPELKPLRLLCAPRAASVLRLERLCWNGN